MLHGVLNMPPELWIGTPIDVMQRHSRYIQASEYIKELTEQRDRLAAALDRITMSGYGILCRQIAREALQSLTTNVKAHTPLPATACDETGVKP
jgi:hypothetical protein